MSVQRNDIVLVGQKFPYSTYKKWSTEVQDEFYRNWCDNPRHDFDKYHVEPKDFLKWDGALTCIFDGMDGEYIYFGFVLSASKAMGDGLPTKEADLVLLQKFSMSVERILGEQVAGLFGEEPHASLHVFSHYS